MPGRVYLPGVFIYLYEKTVSTSVKIISNIIIRKGETNFIMKKKSMILSFALIAGVVFNSCQSNKSEKNNYSLTSTDLSFVQDSDVIANTINNGLIYSLSYIDDYNADMLSFDKSNMSKTADKISKEGIINLFYTENYNIIYSVDDEKNTVSVTDLSDKLVFSVILEKDKQLIDVCEDENSICFLCDDNTVTRYSDTGEHLNDYSFNFENNDTIKFVSDIAEKSDYIYCLATEYNYNDDSSKNFLMKYSEEKCEFESDTELYDTGNNIDSIFFDSSDNLVISSYDDSCAYIDLYNPENAADVVKKEIEGVTHVYGEQSGSLIYEKDGKIYLFDIYSDSSEEIYNTEDEVLISAVTSDDVVRLSFRNNTHLLELTSKDIDGNNISSELITVSEKYVNYLIRDMYVLKNGDIGFVAADYDKGSVCICLYNKNTGAEWFELSGFDMQDESNISLVSINEEFAVIRNMKDLYLYSFIQNKTDSVFVQDATEIISCCVSDDNKLNLLYNKNDSLYLSEFNTESLMAGSEKKIQTVKGTSEDMIISGNKDYKFFLNVGEQLIGVRVDNKEEVLIDWSVSGYKTSINNINILEGDKFLCVSDDNRFVVLEKTQAGEQKVINVGVLGGIPSCYSDYTQSKSGSEYIVNLKDYSEYDQNGDAGIGQFNLDIVSGNTPDVIVFRGAADIDLYREKNLLVSLDSFIDSDPEIKKEDYLSNIFEMNTTDAKLYYITPQVLLRTISGKSENSENTIKGLTENISNYKKEFPFGKISCSQILRYLLSVNSVDVIENSECIREYLEFSKKYGVSDPEDELTMSDYYEGIHNNQIQFMISSFGGFENYNIINKALFDGNVMFCGVSANEKDAVALEGLFSMAITNESTCKDLAWKYIRSFLSDDYQNGISDSYGLGFPVKLSALDCAAKKAQDKNLAISEFPIGNKNIDVGYISDNEIETLIDTIKNCNTKCIQNPKIMSILDEEAKLYFSDESDIDATISSIKNKVSIYINEIK